MDQGSGSSFHFCEIDGEAFGGDVVEAEVFCDGEVWALGEFLVDDSDACVECVVEGAWDEFAAVEGDCAGVLCVEACEDFAEGGFSCAVFAHQRVDFSGEEGHGDIFECLGITETL